MKKYIILIISLFFAALNFNLFLKPLNLVTGGNQGVAIIIKHLTKLKPSFIILIINIIALIICYHLVNFFAEFFKPNRVVRVVSKTNFNAFFV